MSIRNTLVSVIAALAMLSHADAKITAVKDFAAVSSEVAKQSQNHSVAKALESIEHRSLLTGDYSDTSFSAFLGCSQNVYTGGCGPFGKKTDKWSDDICCAASADDCCEVNGGSVAGVVIGIFVFLAIAITSCAWCCKCCCFKIPQPAQAAVMMAPMGQASVPGQPQVLMQPMPTNPQMQPQAK
mmetsp:Transcript_34479/g.55385  ORF Transcript_34479/g.55385 Transcript_34479/m.55385 type:complete len:184 (-) Transcript_34479:311-862(-)|eukprot:CAMPEP_0198685188 /NCGR_PEP_ID=MMETSP1468-20131203/13302_1 /TAXON_ID=1461545 /ORGANISM="Mantoniella sp, Strain CCMP1436" /LENGTH=183 /DNA_ID=CAMNT_0044430517 /DNA_START=224 /DNA_END=775 /DNA_ORIENTATION=+